MVFIRRDEGVKEYMYVRDREIERYRDREKEGGREGERERESDDVVSTIVVLEPNLSRDSRFAHIHMHTHTHTHTHTHMLIKMTKLL